jgi:hypothetical protein
MVCTGRDWCTVLCLWEWIKAHWVASGFTIGGIISLGTAAMTIWRYFRQKRLHRLARVLRNYSDLQKNIELNIHSFFKEGLAQQLGKDAKRINDVLEYMEKQGWAQKTDYRGAWKIL